MTAGAQARIHPSAIVEPGAEIGPGCEIGALAVIGAQVRLGAGVTVKPHAVLTGITEVGEGSTIFSFACVGEVPQDLKYKGEPTRLTIGARCRIREGATLNTGTEGGGGLTRVGDDCLIMAGAHVAHDCKVGNRVILVNNAALAGHCTVEDDVIIGGLSGVHQWVRIGRGAIIGAVTMVTNDVIPYGLVQAPRGELDGLNLVGLKRRGFSHQTLHDLRAAYRILFFGDDVFKARVEIVREKFAHSPEVMRMLSFIDASEHRPLMTAARDE